ARVSKCLQDLICVHCSQRISDRMPLMNIPRNLISDSALVQEVYDLLRENSGRMTFVDIADRIFQLAKADRNTAASLVSDLIGDDPRFIIDDDHLSIKTPPVETLSFNEIDFVVVDIEATSERSQPAGIIEIGAYRV